LPEDDSTFSSSSLVLGSEIQLTCSNDDQIKRFHVDPGSEVAELSTCVEGTSLLFIDLGTQMTATAMILVWRLDVLRFLLKRCYAPGPNSKHVRVEFSQLLQCD
jgi:hypothetical protein